MPLSAQRSFENDVQVIDFTRTQQVAGEYRSELNM
jgi:hypothetical protein